jgi:hypothetical protein
LERLEKFKLGCGLEGEDRRGWGKGGSKKNHEGQGPFFGKKDTGLQNFYKLKI